jgi:hypothetical protein
MEQSKAKVQVAILVGEYDSGSHIVGHFMTEWQTIEEWQLKPLKSGIDLLNQGYGTDMFRHYSRPAKQYSLIVKPEHERDVIMDALMAHRDHEDKNKKKLEKEAKNKAVKDKADFIKKEETKLKRLIKALGDDNTDGVLGALQEKLERLTKERKSIKIEA